MKLIEDINNLWLILGLVSIILSILQNALNVKKYINRFWVRRLLSIKKNSICGFIIPVEYDNKKRYQYNKVFLVDATCANVISDIISQNEINSSVKLLGTKDTIRLDQCDTHIHFGRPIYHPIMAHILEKFLPDIKYYHPKATKYPVQTSSAEDNEKQGLRYGSNENDVIWMETYPDKDGDIEVKRGYVLLAKLEPKDFNQKTVIIILPVGRRAGDIFMRWFKHNYINLAKKSRGKHFCYIFETDHTAEIVNDNPVADLTDYLSNHINKYKM